MKLTLALSCAYFISLAVPAYAYLDPGTGSMLLQGLIAGIATATTILTVYYQRLKTFIFNLLARNKR
ncbi:hypothetical protein FJ428_07915 [Mesorhizobium sp. B2-8-1]|nr:hypothetical protein FJ428_07915 [Mesorhizobium sp. B2-8-1]